ncbi:MAG: protein translocase subunit SecF [Hyphomicrobiaceae bacterium]|nr:protein translocase subunit SecF [Hyphomicrobiaceae bacterium]MCC0008736.1 protein translocase subunit SecF [Hyphomicrobiaceae bacterium]
MFKGVDFWPHGTRLPIMELRRVCIGISWVAALAAIAILAMKGLNFGIDFKGGSLFEIRQTTGTLDVAKVRDTLGGLGLGEVQIQSLDQPGEFLVRVETQKPAQGQNSEQAQQAVEGKVRTALGSDYEFRRTEIVGPAVSGELKQAGVIAVSFAIVGILLYIWFRFEWQFGVAAILALVHDIIITLGVFSLLGLDFGLSEVAALLTLAGYSINDTVVVFDRIRENLRRYKKMALVELMNLSINETLSRTVLTATTTFLAVLALYVFGTEVIKGFSFAMLFGILIGTWSSIFVASPFLLWIGVKRDWSSEGAGAGAKAKA